MFARVITAQAGAEGFDGAIRQPGSRLRSCAAYSLCALRPIVRQRRRLRGGGCAARGEHGLAGPAGTAPTG